MKVAPSEHTRLMRSFEIDLAKNRKEFPMTPMSRALAEAIRLHAPGRAALDVGTGCGIHAGLLCVGGFEIVRAIDVVPSAINHSKARFVRLAEQRNGFPLLRNVEFRTECLTRFQETVEQGGNYDAICFNAPGFYSIEKLSSSSALACGLYTGEADADDARNPKQHPIVLFCDTIVAPYLRQGGVMICTWPAIQRRLVYDGDKVMHPADLLQRWLGWRIAGRRDIEAFFSETSPVKYGNSSRNIAHSIPDLIRRKLYAESFVNPGDPEFGWQPTFRFAVLRLRRLAYPDLSFAMEPAAGTLQ